MEKELKKEVGAKASTPKPKKAKKVEVKAETPKAKTKTACDACKFAKGSNVCFSCVEKGDK